MKKYKLNSHCVKCGCTVASTEYDRLNKNMYKFPLMIRTCKKCGYDWEELPLDSKEEEE